MRDTNTSGIYMKKVLSIVVAFVAALFIAENVQAQKLSTATGRGRHIKNEMLEMTFSNKERSGNCIIYKIPKIEIYAPPARSIIEIEHKVRGNWKKYTIIRDGDTIFLYDGRGNLLEKRKAKVF